MRPVEGAAQEQYVLDLRFVGRRGGDGDRVAILEPYDVLVARGSADRGTVERRGVSDLLGKGDVGSVVGGRRVRRNLLSRVGAGKAHFNADLS